MLAIILPVLKWDAEVSAEAGEYEQLREQHGRQKHVKPQKKKRRISTMRRRFRWRKKVQPFSSPKTQSANRRHQVTVDLSAYLAQNPDFIAWLRVPGTNVVIPSCRRMILIIT